MSETGVEPSTGSPGAAEGADGAAVGGPGFERPAVEASGASLEEAVRRAAAELGVERTELEVEVLSEGSRAVPGERISTAAARVRVRALEPHAVKARRALEELLGRLGVSARVAARRTRTAQAAEPGHEPVVLDVSGDDLGLLIGWRGENLRALQTVVNLMAGDTDLEGRRIIVDVERYRARREDQVRELALRIAHRVKRTGQRYALDPMQAYERRVVHITLESDEGVRTESTGVEPARRLTIHPTGPARPDLPGGPPGPAGSRAPQRGARGPYRGGRGDRLDRGAGGPRGYRLH